MRVARATIGLHAGHFLDSSSRQISKRRRFGVVTHFRYAVAFVEAETFPFPFIQFLHLLFQKWKPKQRMLRPTYYYIFAFVSSISLSEMEAQTIKRMPSHISPDIAADILKHVSMTLR